MSLIKTIHGEEKPNWLASENCMRRKTATAPVNLGVKDDDTGKTFVKSGTIFPSNDGNAEGIIFSDVNVSYGDYPCSLMTAGFVYSDRLPETLTEAAKTALEKSGMHFETSPEFERLY